jgi:arginine repressor
VWIGGRFIASAVGYDPEGDEMSYEWGLTKGEKDYSGWMMVYAATAVVDVPENASGGTYLMKVKVKDSEGGERIFAREIKLTKEAKKGESVCVPSEEICDGLDNDCNGLIDDGVKLVFYKDLDRDGYTDGTTSVGCSAPQGYVLSALLGDCNDENNQINPGKTEICDGIDNNCDGLIDEGVKLVFYKDLDGDGYTDGTTQVGCSAPSGYVLSATSGDCNDNDPTINPAKTEICDGKDNNCNGQIDEGVLLVFYKDKDGDGYGDVNDQTLACAQPTGYVSNSSDCNDNDPNVSPGKTEICDGKDNNCNGQIDEGFNVGQSCSVGVGECARTGQYVCKADGSGTQCNAAPGTPTTEICDGRDNDCDGQIDEGNVCISFAKTIGGSSDDIATSIIQSSDGGYVVAGVTLSFGAGVFDFYVVKLDSSGNVQWTKTIGGSSDDVANSIIQSSDGGYVVAGWTRSFVAGYYYDIYVVKLDSSGNVLWTKTIGGSYNDVANSIIQSSDGGYVVAGWTSSFGAGSADIYVVKLDSSGNVIWTKTIGGSNWDEAWSIIQSSDGGYVVAGWTSSFGAGSADIYVVKLDSSGNVIWTKTIGGSNWDEAWSIIQSSDGGYVVAGETESFGAGVTDIYVVKLDSSGNVLWTKTIGGSSEDRANSIIQSSDGGYVVAGWTSSFGAGDVDIYVVKLDSSGNVVWTKTIGGSSDDFASSIIQSSDGGYVVAGDTSSFGAGIGDIYVVKMDANGNVCFSQNITNYSVSSNVGSFSSPSTISFPQSPTVDTISPTVSSGGSVSDVCPSSPAPHLCSASQDCGFGSAVAINKEDVKSYGCSAGGVLSRFLIPAFMLIVYGWLRKKRNKKKD